MSNTESTRDATQRIRFPTNRRTARTSIDDRSPRSPRSPGSLPMAKVFAGVAGPTPMKYMVAFPKARVIGMRRVERRQDWAAGPAANNTAQRTAKN